MKIETDIDKAYYNDIVSIHKDAFECFFLTGLGDSFLKTYYKAVLSNSNCISVCAFDDNDRVVGFAIGTILSKGFHKKIIKQNIFSFGKELIKLIIRKPSTILRLIKNLEKNEVNDNGKYSELLSIGILKSLRGEGIGRHLIQSFENEVKKRNSTLLTLTTDKYENDKIINFYKKSGYKILYEFTSYPHRQMYKLIKKI